MPMQWLYDDGGRAEAGYTGTAGDCVVRSIAIATAQPYRKVYDDLNGLRDSMRQTKRVRQSSARNGTHRTVYDKYLESIGWHWHPTMHIGEGCRVHLREGELPMGRLIVRVSKHMTAVIDGVIHDTWDPSREGTRCVYGYWEKAEA